MGNNRQSREQQQNLSHLTSDVRYQSLLRQLYANNSSSIVNDFPQFRGNMNYHPNQNRQNVEIKKSTPIRNDLFIDKESLKLIPTDDSTLFNFTFKIQSSVPFIISIYYVAKEQVNQQNITTSIKQQGQQNTFPFDKEVREFPVDAYPLELTKYQKQDLVKCNPQSGEYPIIIKMIPQDEKMNIAMYIYGCCLDNMQKVEIKRIKVEVCGRKNKAYIANDIYGVSQDKQNKDMDCAICLSQVIDTMIIPCKHMCLCRGCCEDLRFRAQKCPICRNNIERFILVENVKNEEQKE